MSEFLANFDDVNNSVHLTLGQFWNGSREHIKNEFNDYFKKAACELTTWTETDEYLDPWEKWLAAVCLFFVAAKLNILPNKSDSHNFIIDKVNLFLPPEKKYSSNDLTVEMFNTFGMDFR